MHAILVGAVLAYLPAADFPRADLLIEPADLAAPVAGRLVLDVRPRKDHDAGHIPDALWIDIKAWDKAFAEPEVGAWSRRLGEAGLDPTAVVVVYGGDDVRDAARLWWILKYWGFADVRLLNGGWSAWRDRHPEKVSREPTPFTGRTVRLTPRREILATKSQLLKSLGTDRPQIIDARSAGEYCGDTTTAKRNGMIPGAVHFEWTETIDPKTRRFKSADELAALIRDRKIDLDKQAVTYCQSGGRAAVVAFTLELMGGKQVRNYYKSWSEWGNAEDTPVEKGRK